MKIFAKKKVSQSLTGLSGNERLHFDHELDELAIAKEVKVVDAGFLVKVSLLVKMRLKFPQLE